jgi:hypothetical protein
VICDLLLCQGLGYNIAAFYTWLKVVCFFVGDFLFTRKSSVSKYQVSLKKSRRFDRSHSSLFLTEKRLLQAHFKVKRLHYVVQNID